MRLLVGILAISSYLSAQVWSGNGTKQIESFQPPSTEWSMSWTVPLEGQISIFVYSDDERLVSTASGKGPGASFVRSKAGLHYIKVFCSEEWKLELTASKPQAVATFEDLRSKATYVTTWGAASPIKKTPELELKQGSLLVSWKCERDPNNHFFSIILLNEKGEDLKLLVNTTSLTASKVVVPVEPGTYFLNVDGRRRWEVEIYNYVTATPAPRP